MAVVTYLVLVGGAIALAFGLYTAFRAIKLI